MKLRQKDDFPDPVGPTTKIFDPFGRPPYRRLLSSGMLVHRWVVDGGFFDGESGRFFLGRSSFFDWWRSSNVWARDFRSSILNGLMM